MSVQTEPATSPIQVPFPVRRFTVDEYHRMIGACVFGDDERFELLEGWVTYAMTRKPPHDATVDLVAEIIRRRLPQGWRVRTQSAITTEDSEPEPDLAVVRGEARDYLKRHPGPADIALVIEVSEATLARDRQVKGRIYARAGIPCYWIVNLEEGWLEAYSEPSGTSHEPCYRRRQDFGREDAVPVPLPGAAGQTIPVRDLLP